MRESQEKVYLANYSINNKYSTYNNFPEAYLKIKFESLNLSHHLMNLQISPRIKLIILQKWYALTTRESLQG